MALQRLTSGDLAADTRAKINAAIDAIEAVQTASTALNEQVEGSIAGIGEDLQDLRERSAADLAALAFALTAGPRPGDYPALFTGSLIGAGIDVPGLPSAGIVSSAAGKSYRLDGADIVAMRAPVRLAPNAFYVLRLEISRAVDAVDPNNHAIDLGIQWLTSTYADAGSSLIRRYRALQRNDGPQILAFRVPSQAGETPALAPPKGALFWRPYLRSYGSDGATLIDSMSVTEATFAGVYAPDVTALGNRLAALEAQIAAGLPFASPVLPSYTVANLPPPGTRGRKAFAQDGRAPNAAGTLEPANAGTGVEVVDTGTKWVISGTNQAVQA